MQFTSKRRGKGEGTKEGWRRDGEGGGMLTPLKNKFRPYLRVELGKETFTFHCKYPEAKMQEKC